MSEPSKTQRFFQNMHQMCSSMDCAEEMTDGELAEALCQIVPNQDIRGFNASIVGEVLHRWNHPFKSRWERFKRRFK